MGTVEDFKHLVGTHHLDSDDGVLYITVEVLERKFPEGYFIVGLRRPYLARGLDTARHAPEAVHIRDIEKMTADYDARLKALDPRNACSGVGMEGGSSYPNQPDRPGKAAARTHSALRDPEVSSSRAHGILSGTGGSKEAPSGARGGRSHRGDRVERTSRGRELLVADDDDGGICDDSHVGQRRKLRDRGVINYSERALKNRRLDAQLVEWSTVMSEGSTLRGMCAEASRGDPIVQFVLEAHESIDGRVDRDPLSHAEAMRGADAHEWAVAEKAEMDSLERLHVLGDVVPLPPGKRVVGTKWVYKRKRDKDGRVSKYKARLVAKGFSQVFGVDYFDTYSPVARLTSLRIVYALAALLDLYIEGMDVDVAFLNASLEEDLYIKSPTGSKPLPQGHVYKLKKALYGLKQSPREWNKTFDRFLKDCQLKQLKTENCIYYRWNTERSAYLIVVIYI